MELKFNDCSLISLEKLFGLEALDESQALQTWLAGEADISAWERDSLKFFRQLLRHNVHNWNEIELIQNFIGPIFALVNFSGKHYNKPPISVSKSTKNISTLKATLLARRWPRCWWRKNWTNTNIRFTVVTW